MSLYEDMPYVTLRTNTHVRNSEASGSVISSWSHAERERLLEEPDHMTGGDVSSSDRRLTCSTVP